MSSAISKILFLSALMSLFSVVSDAAAIKTMMVRYQSGQDTVSAYMAIPEATGKHPALIVIHEWWGLTDWIKQDARNFARKGYLALAIDLYRGKLASDPSQAYRLMVSVPRERAVTDLESAFEYLRTMKNVDASRIGVIGWCMGGSYSFIAATHLPGLAACVIDYGNVDTTTAGVASIHCPVLCNFAGLDNTYTPAMGKTFAGAMRASGKRIEFYEYPDVNHAFMNPNNTSGYSEIESRVAWRRIYTFLHKYLWR